CPITLPALALLKGEWHYDLRCQCDYLTTAFTSSLWSYNQIARSDSRLHAANTKIRADTIAAMIFLMLYLLSGCQAGLQPRQCIAIILWASSAILSSSP